MTLAFDTTITSYSVKEDGIVFDAAYTSKITDTDFPGVDYTSYGRVPVQELLIHEDDIEENVSAIMNKITNGIEVMNPTLPKMLESMYMDKFAKRVSLTDMSLIKTQYKSRVDMMAEATRNIFITPGAGQAMTYQAKTAEAIDYLTAETPNPADYPLLSSELGITGETLFHVAQVVVNMHDMWKVIGSQIETIRLQAKKDIDEAVDGEEIVNIVNAIVWPSA